MFLSELAKVEPLYSAPRNVHASKPVLSSVRKSSTASGCLTLWAICGKVKNDAKNKKNDDAIDPENQNDKNHLSNNGWIFDKIVTLFKHFMIIDCTCSRIISGLAPAWNGGYSLSYSFLDAHR